MSLTVSRVATLVNARAASYCLRVSASPEHERRRRFSMIRDFQFADWFTLGNAVCGASAVFAAMSYLENGNVSQIYLASGLVLAAFVLDVLDGRIARWRQTSSAFGRELDSLADVISFGIAPAALGYACGMQEIVDRIILAYFVACGVSRLARYNVTAEAFAAQSGKVTFFEGTPIPTSIVLVGMLVAATALGAIGGELWLGTFHAGGLSFSPLTLSFAVSGSLMISRVRIPKM